MPTARYWLGRAAGALEAVEHGESKVRDCRARYGAPMLQGIKARAEIRRSVPEAGPNQGATVSMPAPIPSSWSCSADLHITRRAPPGEWLLATPLVIAYALRSVRQVRDALSAFYRAVDQQIPRPLFDAIVMTYRYEWRAMSYALSCTRRTTPVRHPLV